MYEKLQITVITGLVINHLKPSVNNYTTCFNNQ
jgi:hypothetical protein